MVASTLSNSLERGCDPRAQAAPIRQQASNLLGVAEVRALAAIDDLLSPEQVEASIARLNLTPGTGQLDLRLPQPPVRAVSGDALFRSLSGFVERFEDRRDAAQPAELRMGQLLRGIHRLELKIRSEITRGTRL